MTFDDARPSLSPDVFRLLRDYIYDFCGILFVEDQLYLLERRLWPRVEALTLTDFGDYLRYLTLCSPETRQTEFLEIAERVTTNETYFFRESYQLDAFREEILPEIHARRPRGKRLNIWSAGCSTGEEAYTIAIQIHETGLFGDWDVRVFGSDISRRVLSVARRGEYGRNSFRTTDNTFLRRYFREHNGKHQIIDDIRQRCTFGHINLLDPNMLRLVGAVDVIFCRNVLIYFDQRARRQVIDVMHDKLMPGGYLLLGHSESLITLSTAFELVHLRHDMVYRRPVATLERNHGG